MRGPERYWGWDKHNPCGCYQCEPEKTPRLKCDMCHEETRDTLDVNFQGEIKTFCARCDAKVKAADAVCNLIFNHL